MGSVVPICNHMFSKMSYNCQGFLLPYVTEPGQGGGITTESASNFGIALGQHFSIKLIRVKAKKKDLMKIPQLCPEDEKTLLSSLLLIALRRASSSL